MIDISYSGSDPVQAAAVANAFLQAYIDTSLELKVDPARAYRSFFDERAKRLREDLEAAQTRLSSFQKANQLLVSPDRMDVETARLADLSSQLVELQSNAAKNEGKRAQAGARQDQLPEVLADPLVSQLSASLANEQARLQELTTRYGPKHPQLIEQRARLAEVKSKLEAATARATGSVSVNTSVNQAQLARVEKLLTEQRARVLKLQGLRDEGEVLRRDLENAQTAYSSHAAALRPDQCGKPEYEYQRLCAEARNRTGATVLAQAAAKHGGGRMFSAGCWDWQPRLCANCATGASAPLRTWRSNSGSRSC